MIIQLSLCANDRYFPGLYCTLGSALTNLNPSYTAIIHIIDADLSTSNKDQIELLCSKRGNHSVKWISPDRETFRCVNTNKHHISTYYRLAIPTMLDTDRVIYLDSDLLVFGCLGNLWKTALGSSVPIAAVQDWETSNLSTDSPRLVELGNCSPTSGYFNAGLLIMNLDLLRRGNFTEQACEMLLEYDGLYRFADQTALNWWCFGNWTQLDSTWNTPAFAVDRDPASDLPKVIHFTNCAPWLRREFKPSHAIFERVSRELNLELPAPETRVFRSSLIELARWCLAPLRVASQLIRFGVSYLKKTKEEKVSALNFARYWTVYFLDGPRRTLSYCNRIRKIKKTDWDTLVHGSS